MKVTIATSNGVVQDLSKSKCLPSSPVHLPHPMTLLVSPHIRGFILKDFEYRNLHRTVRRQRWTKKLRKWKRNPFRSSAPVPSTRRPLSQPRTVLVDKSPEETNQSESGEENPTTDQVGVLQSDTGAGKETTAGSRSPTNHVRPSETTTATSPSITSSAVLSPIQPRQVHNQCKSRCPEHQTDPLGSKTKMNPTSKTPDTDHRSSLLLKGPNNRKRGSEWLLISPISSAQKAPPASQAVVDIPFSPIAKKRRFF